MGPVMGTGSKKQGSRMMAVSRWVRRIVRTGVASVLVGACAVGAGVARADDVITTQPYVDVYGLDATHKKGLDGEGVTIALISTKVDTSVPELKGADITEVQTLDQECGLDPLERNRTQGTAIASLLVSKGYGWAPKAKMLSYPVELSKDNQENLECKPNSIVSALSDAVSRGVDVISMHIESHPFEVNAVSVMRAAEAGIPVVWTATDREFVSGEGGAEAMLTNGVVAVGGHDENGQIPEWSPTSPGLTMVALGVGITGRFPDESGAMTVVRPGGGNSTVSTAMVSGALALGVQKWPQANGNQLVRALLKTAAPCTSDGTWSDQCGYGALNPGQFFTSDPLNEETTNPLMEKNPQQVGADRQYLADYKDGLLIADKINEDIHYTYRGVNLEARDVVGVASQMGSSPRYMKRIEEAEQAAGLTAGK
ncbi:MAG: hypothetical protein CSA82_01735 [Actinobacteria bacterium]|nr:MAG: hypothetical protein CSA82_01735 [Actinomycetota bacterium]